MSFPRLEIIDRASDPDVRFSGAAFLSFFILCLTVNWPGRLNEDSLQQLIGFYQRSRLEDLHNPAVTWMWSLPSALLAQPAAALVVQSALLSFYGAMLPRPYRSQGQVPIAAIAETLFKLSLVILAGFVIKDTLLIGLLLCALVALQRASGAADRRVWLIASAALFLLSVFVRSTNFLMFVIAGALLIPLLVRGWRWQGALAFAGTVALLSVVPFNALVNSYAFGAKKSHAEVQPFLFDVSGISVRTNRNLLAGLPGWPKGLPDPRQCYRSSEAAIYAPWSPCRGYGAAAATVYAKGRGAVLAWWLRSIAMNPVAYLAHRSAFSSHLLDPVGSVRHHPIYSRAGGDRFGRYLYAINTPGDEARFRRMLGTGTAQDQLQSWQDSPVANGFARLTNLLLGGRWVVVASLLASLALLAWAYVRNHRGRVLPPGSVTVAAALAVGNFVMHAAIGIGSQERYLYPTVFCALFATLTTVRHVLAQRESGRSRDSGAMQEASSG